jgi:alpha-glucosidase
MFDREELVDIYKSWRKIFNEYNPPKFAVGEAGARLERRDRYASDETLGQAFNFEFLETPWTEAAYKKVISDAINFAERTNSSSTWVLSNHDVVRHASRFGLPIGTNLNQWLLSNGTTPKCDVEKGLTIARAAIMLLLGLPGCTYLYQGEELGTLEVADLKPEQLADPIWKRTGGKEKGRDGCRVPINWSVASLQDTDADSMLNFYRNALKLRKILCTDESFQFIDSPAGTISFKRSGNWRVFTNFGDHPVALPEGKLLLASAPIGNNSLPANATAWLNN